MEVKGGEAWRVPRGGRVAKAMRQAGAAAGGMASGEGGVDDVWREARGGGGGEERDADRRPRGTRRGGGRGWLTARAYTHSPSLHLLIVHGVGFSLPIAA